MQGSETPHLGLTFNSVSSYKALHAKSLQSYLTLCDPVGYNPPGSSVQGILQARKLEWVAMPSSNLGVEPLSLMSPAFAAGFFTTRAMWEAQL